MSKTKWTNEQWAAISERNCNMLVAAAAGAGKTAVLVERIIQKITDRENPTDIDKLLIVTFTNAAAAEMRERIAEAISQALENNTDSHNIQRQLTLLNKASITTIHSFCLEVIRNNFHVLNIDPDFRIANETEAALMKLESLQELFEEIYEQADANQDFFTLLECYGGNRDDQALQDMILNLYNFIQSCPWPEIWLREKTEELLKHIEEDFSQTSWGGIILEAVDMELKILAEKMIQALETVQNENNGLQKYAPVFAEDVLSIEKLLKISSSTNSDKWDRLFVGIQAVEFSRLPSVGKDSDKNIQEYVKDIRDEVKARLRKIKERFFLATSSEITEDLQSLYPLMKCLSRLVLEFGQKYALRKSQKSVLDFNDLEHFCLQILTVTDEHGNFMPSGVAQSYRECFSEILVDEYQDSNDVQEFIINMLAKKDNPNVFMVGDVKQSIYRFRQAKPELFLQKYNNYASDKGAAERKILLYKNFRSRQEILLAVNYIFKQIMSEKVGELDYTDAEALNPGAVFAENELENTAVGGEVELHLLQTGGHGQYFNNRDMHGENENRDTENNDTESLGVDGENNEEEQTEILENIQCEARLVAQQINRLLISDDHGREFHVWDKNINQYRKAEYRDIVVLLRTTKNWSDIFLEELSAQGIPTFADTGTGFFKTTEIQVIMSLLQIIDNPLQDIPLLAVLRSPIAGFDTNELAEIRLADRKAPLFQALQILAAKNNTLTAEKAADFCGKLNKWRHLAHYTSTEKLLWQLYDETGYYGAVGAMPLGEQRQANLRILFERARQFEETSYKGLFNFVNFVDKLKDSRNDMGSAKILGENDNVVRIMSIHKSKGLEFPVVILAGCGKKFNLQDMNKSILLHHDLGFGPEVVNPGLRLSYPSLPKQAIREKVRAETLSEEMRILYVALTRAREKLIITATVNDLGKDINKWAKCAGTDEEKLPRYEVLHSNRYIDWIGPALIRHQNCSLRPAEFKGQLTVDHSDWKVNKWDMRDIRMPLAIEEENEQKFINWLEAETPEKVESLQEEINRRLSWEYAFAAISRTPAKITVTEAKRLFERNISDENGSLSTYEGSIFTSALIKRPKFMEEKKGLSAAEAGTILHFVMQHLNYEGEDIPAQIDKMIKKDLLTKQQAASISINKIQTFLNSSLGKRMCESHAVNREVPFNLEIPCNELYNQFDSMSCQGENILLQGVIDCFFEESDGLVLIDYKTDYVPEGGAEQLRDRYKAQITYYARALETLAGKRVKEKYIYLFYNGETLEY